MKRQIYEGATLKCSLGTCQSTLKIPTGHGSSVKDKNQATVTDRKGGVNIMSFASCKRSSPPVSCSPTILVDWLNGQNDFIVKSEQALLNVCIVPCALGGIIEIVD
jgi:hypothetical protein